MPLLLAPVQEALTGLNVPHDILSCPPELADTQDFCRHYGYDLQDAANTLLVAASQPQDRLGAFVVLATTKLVNRRLRECLLAKRVSFASAEITRAITGMELGGVTPLGLPEDLALFIDAEVLRRPFVLIGGGHRHAKIKLAPAALASLPGATVVAGLAEARH